MGLLQLENARAPAFLAEGQAAQGTRPLKAAGLGRPSYRATTAAHRARTERLEHGIAGNTNGRHDPIKVSRPRKVVKSAQKSRAVATA
jgi:hypothetical protein